MKALIDHATIPIERRRLPVEVTISAGGALHIVDATSHEVIYKQAAQNLTLSSKITRYLKLQANTLTSSDSINLILLSKTQAERENEILDLAVQVQRYGGSIAFSGWIQSFWSRGTSGMLTTLPLITIIGSFAGYKVLGLAGVLVIVGVCVVAFVVLWPISKRLARQDADRLSRRLAERA